MKRAIVVPAELAGAALDELKQWLAITTPRDDAALAALLRAALELCEGFTGAMPLEATCEEVLARSGAWQKLQTRPVQAVLAVEGLDAAGTRVPLAAEDYAIDLDADGAALVRVVRGGSVSRVAVRFTAGLAQDWAGLPEGLRQGALRLAADLYRQRDLERAQPVPPAAVAALWRPWRRLRLA